MCVCTPTHNLLMAPAAFFFRVDIDSIATDSGFSETSFDGIGFGLGVSVIIDPVKASLLCSQVFVYKILFHCKALFWEYIILLLPPLPAKPTVLQYYCTRQGLAALLAGFRFLHSLIPVVSLSIYIYIYILSLSLYIYIYSMGVSVIIDLVKASLLCSQVSLHRRFITQRGHEHTRTGN